MEVTFIELCLSIELAKKKKIHAGFSITSYRKPAQTSWPIQYQEWVGCFGILDLMESLQSCDAGIRIYTEEMKD